MCFLNFVFEDDEDKVYELVIFDKIKPFQFSLKYVNVDELIKIYEEGRFTFDFKLDKGYLLWDGQHRKVTTEELNQIKTRDTNFGSIVPCLYDLLGDIIEANGTYIDYDIPMYNEEGKLLGLKDESNGRASFRDLKISKSTMNVYITILTEEGFRTRSIVKMKDGKLDFNEFSFIVREDQSLVMEEKYGLKREGSFTDGETYVLFKVTDGLGVYPMINPYFKICDPMLNYKIYLSERDKVAIDFLTDFINSTLKSMYPDKDEEDEESKTEKVHVAYNEDSKYNVGLRLLGVKLPNYETKSKMLSTVLEIFSKMQQENWTGQMALDSMRKRAFNDIEIYAMLMLLQALLTTNKSLLDRIECARKARKVVKSEKVRIDLELFMYRSYIYLSNFKFPLNTDNYIMRGGTSPYESEIKKRIKGWI